MSKKVPLIFVVGPLGPIPKSDRVKTLEFCHDLAEWFCI